MLKFIKNWINIVLLIIGGFCVGYLYFEYQNFTSYPQVVYLSIGIFVFNAILAIFSFSKHRLASYFLIFTADIILALNIFLLIGLTK